MKNLIKYFHSARAERLLDSHPISSSVILHEGTHVWQQRFLGGAIFANATYAGAMRRYMNSAAYANGHYLAGPFERLLIERIRLLDGLQNLDNDFFNYIPHHF